MTHLLAIAVGGALGSMLRYVVAQLVQSVMGKGFPYGTLSVNVIGSLLIGVFAILFLQKWDIGGQWRAFASIGLLGGFTTFSTFSMDTVNLLLNGEILKAAGNVFLSVVLCLFATWLGITVTKQLV